MKALLVLSLVLGLAACAGAPKKSAPLATSSARPETGTAGVKATSRKQSPYAPAQEDPAKRGDYVAGGLYAPHVRDSVPEEIVDVDAIPEPEVTHEPRSRVGNRKTYSVLGKKYEVLENAQGYVETGVASFYGKKFHGRRTSNLEVYDMYTFSAAHKTLPLPSFARVTNLDNGKSVVVRVNDRGPFHAGRIIDLSYAAATKLGYVRQGTARVEVRALTPGESAVEYAGEGDKPKSNGTSDKPTAMDKLVAGIPTTAANAAGKGELRQDRVATPDYRFDMRADGRTMSADEFDAWMKARRLRVATGRPGKPMTTDTAISASVPQPPASHGSAKGESVYLQVASFAARANADRALTLLQGAGIDTATLSDGDAKGQKVWRLRVGPLAETVASELTARIVGLGFGTPQRVRE